MIDPTTLRALIREVIATVVAAARGGKLPPPAPAPAGTAPAEPVVRIAGDADLAAFARSVLALAADPATRQAIEGGRHPFRLAASHAPAGSAPAPRSGVAAPRAAAGPARIMEGVVSEKTFDGLPRGTTVLHIGPDVAVTPLARDKARALKITIERTRP